MIYGFCSLPVVPMRAEATDRAEMVSQLLFGDTFVVEQKGEKWSMVVADYDGYRGWVDTKQIYLIDEQCYTKVRNWKGVTNELITTAKMRENDIVIPMGSTVPTDAEGGDGLEIVYAHYAGSDTLLDIAAKWIGVPYLWGGKTCMGVDCSGFTQTVFKTCGIKLLRDASQQAAQGVDVDNIADALPNDLCFFRNDDGRIIHVGIYMGNGQIIHASGCVRVDGLDTRGIYNSSLQRYTHTLSAIRRVR